MNKKSPQPAHIKTAIVEAILSIQADVERGGKLTGVPTGFCVYDRHTSGLQKSTVNVVAGPPGSGKTEFLLQVAVNAASEGHPVLYVHERESAVRLARRLLLSRMNLSEVNASQGFVSNEKWDASIKPATELSALPIRFCNTDVDLATLDLKTSEPKPLLVILDRVNTEPAEARTLALQTGAAVLVSHITSGNTRFSKEERKWMTISETYGRLRLEFNLGHVTARKLSLIVYQRGEPFEWHMVLSAPHGLTQLAEPNDVPDWE